MIVLAVDTAGAACSAALWRDGAILSRRVEPMVRGHAEALMPMIRALAGEAGVALAGIDLFAVAIGPGAFTGLRVGIAACGGMALAANRPIVGITNFEAAAHGVPAACRAGRHLLVALDSRRAELFAQLFDQTLAAIGPPACLTPTALATIMPPGPVLVTGDAADAAAAGLAEMRRQNAVSVFGQAGPADPAVIATLAADRAELAQSDPPAPLYLRPPDATPAPAPRQIAP